MHARRHTDEMDLIMLPRSDLKVNSLEKHSQGSYNPTYIDILIQKGTGAWPWEIRTIALEREEEGYITKVDIEDDGPIDEVQ
ncbi:hypothetical protein WG66_002428 [Moniliophthora roreri]|nr:hypothetical protein WG66_002428 [Moniliophthora roreri]